MNRRDLFRATIGGLLLPAVTERVRTYSFVGGWHVSRATLPAEFFDTTGAFILTLPAGLSPEVWAQCLKMLRA